MRIRFLKIIIGVLFFNTIPFLSFCQNALRDSNIEIKTLLPEGKIQFEVLDSMEVTARQTELMDKFQKAYQENSDIFNDYFAKIRNNQKAKYPKNKFLSQKEFNEFMGYANNVKLLPSQTEIVEVVYSDDNRISFKASGKLAIIFSQITYNAEANTFDLANHYTLNFQNAVNVETNTNAFQEAWKGYNWVFAVPNDIEEMPTMENLNNLSIKQYKITLGKLMSSGKTFMIIKLKDFQEGNWVTNVEVPIRMK